MFVPAPSPGKGTMDEDKRVFAFGFARRAAAENFQFWTHAMSPRGNRTKYVMKSGWKILTSCSHMQHRIVHHDVGASAVIARDCK
jgi:hypothetical protein